MRGRNRIFPRRRLCSRNSPQHLTSVVLGRGVLRHYRAEAARKGPLPGGVDACQSVSAIWALRPLVPPLSACSYPKPADADTNRTRAPVTRLETRRDLEGCDQAGRLTTLRSC